MLLWIILGVVIGLMFLIIVLTLILTSYKHYEKKVMKHIDKGNRIFTVKINGFGLQNKSHKLEDFAEQHHYHVVEHTMQTKTTGNIVDGFKTSQRRVITFKKN